MLNPSQCFEIPFTRFSNLLGAIALTAAPLLGSAAQAAVYNIASNTGPLQSPDSFASTLTLGSAQSGTLRFNIPGYSTLDGATFHQDNFTLSLNGTPIYGGSFDLGSDEATPSS